MDDTSGFELVMGSMVILSKALKRVTYEFAIRSPAEAQAAANVVLQTIPRDFAVHLPDLADKRYDEFRAFLAKSVDNLLQEALTEASVSRRLN
ncbi:MULTISPECIES: hypothetical protein [Bradyrhizobium]|uniref:hypothetical protein n=1 Tax=Bradyrhizobium TaxID=374 RepID=UPI001EDB2838|nr:hypothetical protein [Bradyrhizobium zhengyangense]MCG2645512.1 hypothetical protein [Bradyrhizobium zhengyangense]